MDIQDILNDDSIKYKATAAIMTDKRLTLSTFRLFILMVSTCQELEVDEATFTSSALAKRAHMSRTTVTTSIDTLEKIGYITADRVMVKGKSQRSAIRFSISGSAAVAMSR